VTSAIALSPLLEDNRVPWQALTEHFPRYGLDPGAIRKIEQLAIASPYALNQLQRNSDWMPDLLALDGFSLDDEIMRFEADQKIDLDQLKRSLRQYRHRKMVEIIYLDVVDDISVEQSLAFLSELADQLITTALDACYRHLSDKHGLPEHADGQPMQLNVIAMGKLGGGELNFSSDIDLICCYTADGELSGYGRLSYQEFFTRLVRLLSQVLSDNTADGFVYRVDLRLRPWGDSGPVVLSHSAIEHYYQLHGREWEQYAMVKARVLSGNAEERRHLDAIIKPFVYRKYHDYRVFEGLAALKDKIDHQARARGMRDNLKVGQGGIREIEFFVQAFQILKGGRNRRLQSTSILACFDSLARENIVDAETLRQLREAYCFLRRLENRIQMFDDRQTHDLPKQAGQRARIASQLGYDSWDDLALELQRQRQRVDRCFNELFKREDAARTEIIIDDSFEDDDIDERQWPFITEAGLSEADEISRHLNRFIRSKAWGFMSARAKQRFNTLLPELIETIGRHQDQAALFAAFMRLFSSIAGRSVYFELLYQNSALLERLGLLFSQSAWIADEVARYPILLENLIQSGGRERFDRGLLQQRLQNQLANVEGDVELELDTLRLFKRDQTLVIASAELAGEIDSREVGRYLSDLAEVVLDCVLQLASNVLQAKHGLPRCSEDGNRREAEFAIIGYGKLGGRELHYQSDLDVIFLHDSRGDEQVTDGPGQIDNSQYFARLAQKVISMTSVLTASGKLYEIDSRLRPEGSSGLLVSASHAYLRYQLENAWTWEHQALIRARWLAGGRRLEQEFNAIREEVLRTPRDPAQLARDIVDMRERIYRSKRPPEGERLNLKHSRGCMVDIEFMVQYWVLAHANSIGSGRLYSDNIALLDELFRLNLITRSQSKLVDVYQTYHRLLHESVLHNESAEIDAELIADEVNLVTRCWNECFGLEN
jgi:glutamate-ammonia-ligase adenylyltransferase